MAGEEHIQRKQLFISLINPVNIECLLSIFNNNLDNYISRWENWNHIEFKKGMLVLLDIYGTNHDTRIWKKPFDFWTERFNEKKDKLFSLIPHGGGVASNGH